MTVIDKQLNIDRGAGVVVWVWGGGGETGEGGRTLTERLMREELCGVGGTSLLSLLSVPAVSSRSALASLSTSVGKQGQHDCAFLYTPSS